MKKLWAILALLGSMAIADTPPPGVVGIKGETDGTKIGNVTDSLKVNVTNFSTAVLTVPTPLPVIFPTPQAVIATVAIPTPLPVSGSLSSVGTIISSVGIFQEDPSTPITVSGNFTTTPSGTQNVSQGTSPWVSNISQFGGSNVVTGIGASGAGIPRVSLSNDSAIQSITNSVGVYQLNVPWVVGGNVNSTPIGTTTVSGTVTSNQGTSPWVSNVSQFGGNNVVTGVGASGLGIPRVTFSTDSTITSIGAISSPVTANQGTSPWVSSISNSVGVFQKDPATPITVSGNFTTSGTQTVTGTVAVSSVNSSVGVFQQAPGSPFTVSGTVNTVPSGTQTISGTVTSNQGTSPWVSNVSQFGGNNVVTGYGSGGLGIPRVSLANDSTLTSIGSVVSPITANQGTNPWTISGTVASTQSTSPWVDNVSQFGGSAVVTGLGASGLGIPRVTLATDSTLTSIGSISNSVGVFQQNNPWISKTMIFDGGGIVNSVKPLTVQVAGTDNGMITQSVLHGLNSSGGGTYVDVKADPSGALDVSASQSVSSSPWVDNISQFGGNNVVTGLGSSGLGVPRVTLATDSTLTSVGAVISSVGIFQKDPATPITVSIPAGITVTPAALQNVNLTQFGSNNVVTGLGSSGLGIPRVTLATDSTLTSIGAINIAPGQSVGLTTMVSGGMTTFRSTSLTSTASVVKTTGGNLYYYHLYNTNSADCFLSFYDVASGSVTAGTTVPKLTLAVPGGGVLDGSLGFPAVTFNAAITVNSSTINDGGHGSCTTSMLVDLGYQ